MLTLHAKEKKNLAESFLGDTFTPSHLDWHMMIISNNEAAWIHHLIKIRIELSLCQLSGKPRREI